MMGATAVTGDRKSTGLRVRLRPETQAEFTRIQRERRWSQTETAAVLVEVYRAAEHAGLVVNGAISERKRRRRRIA